jgi:N-acetylmuramoyl-L-alanine amidase
LASKVSSLLRTRGCEVLLTRVSDVYVAPDGRTSYANLFAHADLFVSLCASNFGVYTHDIKGFLPKRTAVAPRDQSQLYNINLKVKQDSQQAGLCLHERLAYLADLNNIPISNTITMTYALPILIGAEMPAVAIGLAIAAYDKIYDYALAWAISLGILDYFAFNTFYHNQSIL